MRRYQDGNRLLHERTDRIVFIGDSITELWNLSMFFPGRSYVNRGIDSQTTYQIVLRFHQDVLDLHPKAVVILAGINDLGGKMGHVSLEQTESNYEAMAEMAMSHKVEVIFASVLPVAEARAEKLPPERILALNAWLKSYCAHSGATYLDYFSRMVDERGFLQTRLSDDGVHPNAQGYELMASTAESAIQRRVASQ
jgi:acyl-CoA thioesterase-1